MDMPPSPIARARILSTGLFALAAFALGFAVPAQAQNYPWCLMSSAYEGASVCSYTSFDQCMATRLGIGGFCQTNPQFQASAAPTPRRTLKARAGKPS
jgi:Protein of unknown function (DUF3551)